MSSSKLVLEGVSVSNSKLNTKGVQVPDIPHLKGIILMTLKDKGLMTLEGLKIALNINLQPIALSLAVESLKADGYVKIEQGYLSLSEIGERVV